MAKKKRPHEAEAETSGVEPQSELLGGGGGPRDDEPKKSSGKKKRREGGSCSEGGGESGSIIDNTQSCELATRVGYQAVASPLKIQEMEKPVEPYYEVFLSFRGPDNRHGITNVLYNGLIDARIRAYRDDEELCVGEEIGLELLQSNSAVKNLDSYIF